MATSPILLKSTPFDATLNHTLQFTYSGSQIFAHRIVIRNNATNAIVYDKKTSAMNLQVTVPANTLTNGVTYNFQVSVFDHEDKESPLSNAIIVKCLASPILEFANVTDGMIVRNSYLDVELNYQQENDELLNEYTIILYAANQTTILYNSGTKYSSDALVVRVPELMDDTTYYLRATGETVNGMEMDTGLVQIVCDYIKPDLFLKFRADNIPEEGIARLTSNFILVEGSSNPEDLIYIDGEKVSLLNDEKIWFDSGYQTKNFTEQIIAEGIPDFAKFTTMDMKSVKCYITWNYGFFDDSDEKQYYAELTAYHYIGDKRLNYILISNRIPPLNDGEQVHFWIRHLDGAFDLIITKMTQEQIVDVIERSDDT